MARTDSIPVYSIDGKKLMKFVSVDVAAAMRDEKYHPSNSNKYECGSDRKYGERREWLQLLPIPKLKDSNNFSKSTITRAESERSMALRVHEKFGLGCPAHGKDCPQANWRGSKTEESCEAAGAYMAADEKVRYYDPNAVMREVLCAST